MNLFERNYSKANLQIDLNIKEAHLKMKYNVAKKIYNSNTSVNNHQFSDMSLFALKRAELDYLMFISKLDFKLKNWKSLIKLYINIGFIWFNLLTTNGGTSLKRLFLSFFVILFISNFFIFHSGMQNTTYKLCTSGNDVLLFFKAIPMTLSVLLGYGYTGFQYLNTYQFVLVNILCLIGLIFYAILISVIIRKIYK